jgi:uncharacterized protein YecE (DUF72 family)
MEIRVGTSGWYYGWNQDKTLDWYLENSSLNAIELNASFYRFPFPNQTKSWAKKGTKLKWVIKVNRLITHQYKFSEKAIEVWSRFHNLFLQMDEMIDFYLFQLPPILTPHVRDNIARFVEKTDIRSRCALEPRNQKWFTQEQVEWAKKQGITWVSIDAPEFSREIFKTTNTVYLRMHGRTDWYSHNYTAKELKSIASRIIRAKSQRVFIFFNNDHNMLKNAQMMMKTLKAISKKMS